MNVEYKTVEDMIIKLQSLKGEAKVEFLQKLGEFYDQRSHIGQSITFMFDGDPFSKYAQGIGFTRHGATFFKKFL